MNRIGIYGGSFNPIHKDHEYIINYLLENDILDKIIIVPTGDNYKKNDLISSNHRLNMIKLICNNNTIIYSEYELNELKYTYETLDYFNSIYPNSKLYFIMGSDNYNLFDTFKNYKYILDQYNLIVIKRDKIIKDFNYNNNVKIIELDLKLSSSIIRNNIELNKNNLNKKVYNYIKKNKLY